MALDFKFKELELNLPELDADTMRGIGESTSAGVKQRILFGTDISDGSAKPLSPKYARRKARDGRGAGRKPIRNWMFTGDMLRAMSILQAEEDFVEIGFSDPWQAIKAHLLREEDGMWGFSPHDVTQLGGTFADVAQQMSDDLFKK